MLNHILLADFFHIEDGFRGAFLLDPEIDVIPMVSSLSELSVGYNIGVKPRNECNVSQQKETLSSRRVDVDLNVAISFHVGTAVPGQNRINLIELLICIKSIDVIADMHRRFAVENEAVHKRIARCRKRSILSCKRCPLISFSDSIDRSRANHQFRLLV